MSHISIGVFDARFFGVFTERTDNCRLNTHAADDNLVSMTRIRRRSKSAARQAPKAGSGHWLLQDAKARFSELVRKVRSEGPQHVTVHGRDEVVVIAAEDFRRLKGEKTGQALIKAFQASPGRDIDLTPARSAMVVRGVAV
jgi:prevent-host-death family protein